MQPDPQTQNLQPVELPKSRGQIKIAPSERWLIAGVPGTGKTTFCRELIKQCQQLWPGIPVYILDSKGQADDFANWPGLVEQEHAPRVSWRYGDTQVWRSAYDALDEYDVWFERILHNRRPAIVYVDELSSICHGNLAVDGYKKLVKQGRGHNICVITGSQELSYIPRQTSGMMTHMVRFRLIDDYDRRKGNRLVGKPAKTPEPRHKYGFWYSRTDIGSARAFYYDSFKSFF